MAIILENTDINTAGVGITATTDTYVVEHNVHVSAQSQGFSTVQDGTELINFGGVYSATSDAVRFSGQHDVLINETGGSIAGDTGVKLNGTGSIVENLGSIFGLVDYGFDQLGTGSLDNRGYLFGQEAAVYLESPSAGVSIVNSGVIESPKDGVLLTNALYLPSSIVNTGTITGAHSAISVFNGALMLQNFGEIVGKVDCISGENDAIVNAGTILGIVRLGGGDDSFVGTGGTSATILGLSGKDTITGGSQADFISGGADRDTLTGGSGSDTFDFSAITDSTPGAARDLIRDFKHAQHDHIRLADIDANLVAGGHQAFHYIGTDTFAHYHVTHSGVFGLVRFAGGILQAQEHTQNGEVALEVKLGGVAHLYAADLLL